VRNGDKSLVLRTIVTVKPGAGTEQIVIGAHDDSASAERGAIEQRYPGRLQTQLESELAALAAFLAEYAPDD